jgi:hypothetical protein
MVSEMAMETAMEMAITSQSNRYLAAADACPETGHCSNHFFAPASH